MSLFRSKYRIESARLPQWDYSSPGWYFVTMCTHNRECMFGNIVEGKMRLNRYGIMVEQEWHKSFEIRHEMNRDEFVVMPNHFHGIIQISDSRNLGETHTRNDSFQTVETHGRASLPNIAKSQIGVAFRTQKSISSFMAGFKSAVTKRINESRKMPGVPIWQPRFHDHIIRNDRELFAIRRYIRNNPANWADDRNVMETQAERTGKQPRFVYLP